ncbi:hypothetical protein CU663_02025 [Pseudomonas syringae pv. actinidifoliorum]|nr:hypothetical protein [Pseudomonas syringae pv. actinidifoliorum]
MIGADVFRFAVGGVDQCVVALPARAEKLLNRLNSAMLRAKPLIPMPSSPKGKVDVSKGSGSQMRKGG